MYAFSDEVLDLSFEALLFDWSLTVTTWFHSCLTWSCIKSQWQILRVVQTQAILFLKWVSERGGSDTERPRIWMMSSSIDFESISKFIIQFQSRCMSDPILFDIDVKNGLYLDPEEITRRNIWTTKNTLSPELKRNYEKLDAATKKDAANI